MADIEMEVSVASVITNTVDSTLKNSGEAADAKAVGDALALKANSADIPPETKVNNVEPEDNGNIKISGEDINVESSGTTTIKDKFSEVDETISDIEEDADGFATRLTAIEDDAVTQSTGGTIAGDVYLKNDDEQISYKAQLKSNATMTEDVVVTLPAKSGTLALQNGIYTIPNGTYTYEYACFSGHISGSSGDIRVFVPTGYIKGKNITNVGFDGAVSIRGIGGYIYPLSNSSGSSVSEDTMKENCNLTCVKKSDFGFTLSVAKKDDNGFFNASSTTKATNNTPTDVSFNTKFYFTVADVEE